MKRTILFIIWLLSFFPSLAVETYITFNPASCMSCVSGIYRICKVDKIKSIQIVAKEEYANDTEELNKLYEFNRFPKIRLVFSDSLYNALSAMKYEAELVIRDKQKELYRRNVKQVIVNEQLLAYYAAPQNIDSLCSPFIGRTAGIDIGKHYIVMFGEYLDYNVIDRATGVEKPVKLTEPVVVDLYKLLYKNNFSERYPVIKEMIKETPTYKPTIEDIREWDNENLMILGNIKDYKHNKAGDTVFMLNRPYVMKYKYNTGKITSVYPLDSTMPSGFDLWQFYVADGKYYGQGYDNDNDLFKLLELTCNEKTKTFSMKRDTKMTQPSTYAQRKVSSLEEYNIRIKGNLMCFVYDNKITLLNSGKQVSIPFKDYGASKWNAYEIRDLHEDNEYYYVLYVHDKEFHIMRLRKDNMMVDDVVVGNVSSIDTTKLKLFQAGDKIIYHPKGKECLLIKQVEF